MSDPNLSLEALEALVAAGQVTAGRRIAVAFLESINTRFGSIGEIALSKSMAQGVDEARRFATRFAGALGALITADPPLSQSEFGAFIAHHRWIDLLFSLSGYASSEHLLGPVTHGRNRSAALRRFLTLFPASTTSQLDFDAAERDDPNAVYSALLHYVASRYCFSDSAYELRERALEWLPGRVSAADIPELAPDTLVEPYMQCSYATTARKHEVKADIIQQMRRALIKGGCPELTGAPKPAAKPVIVVTTEAFGVGHSVFRTHSKAVASLRRRFHVVGVCFAASISPEVSACFDEVLLYPPGDFVACMRWVCREILTRQALMIMQVGVGMAPHTIALASLRLAPVQTASFAHTATTMSPYVDYMVLPRDFVGDPKCFSEPLVMLAPEAMPYAERRDGDAPAAHAKANAGKKQNSAILRIAVPASVMKLNPRHFAALAAITERAARAVEFHFFPLGGVGLARLAIEKNCNLTNAVVHAEAPYPVYLDRLATCEFALSPFPYGNVNSVIDSIRLGLPGVCLDGPQPHAHADASLFRRAGLPSELISQSVDDYIAAAVKLVDDGDWRDHCQERARNAPLEAAVFNGDASLFCDALYELLAS